MLAQLYKYPTMLLNNQDDPPIKIIFKRIINVYFYCRVSSVAADYILILEWCNVHFYSPKTFIPVLGEKAMETQPLVMFKLRDQAPSV